MREISPVTHGEMLMEEFLKPLRMTQYRLAKEIGVSQRRIGEIVAGTRAITPGHRSAILPVLQSFRWLVVSPAS